jgi:hypothetical protein
MRHPITALLIVAGLTGAAAAAESKPAKGKARSSAELSQLDQEEQWVFDPKPGRLDIFYDREAVARVLSEIRAKGAKETTDPDAALAAKANAGNADAITLAQQEQAHIEALMVARKYDDVVKVSDSVAKRLERHADVPEVAKALARIKTYRDQADEAITRNEAQAAFDALALRIQGILWSQTGARLVILSDEKRALGINERVKDCVIINIDSDRVDFRFHYKRKRFEFPLYVGEKPKDAK